MGNEAINAPLDVGKTFSEWVWYSSNAALSQGEAVCYNWDYGTATDKEPSRYNRVETPTTLNAQHFAGVAARAYSAKSGGQFIEIFKPGSVCNVLCGKDTDTGVGVGLLTFDVTATFKGEFRYAGLPGAGSAQPLQETTGDGTSPDQCLALLQEGPQSGGVEVVALQTTGGVWAIGEFMVGGTSLISGGAITGEHDTIALADPTIVTVGLRKKFGIVTAAVSGYSIVITPDSGVASANGASAIATFTATANENKSVAYQWLGAWSVIGLTATKPAIT